MSVMQIQKPYMAARANELVTTYTTENGASVTLSPQTVRNYLVNGNQNITDSEVHMFIQLCYYQKINPFLREAYLIKYGSSPATMVCGKELFTKRAEKHADFRGYEAGIIILTKTGKLENRTGTTIIKSAGETLVGGWAKVYREKYKVPIEGTAMLDEYRQSSPLWSSKTATMIRKVALVQALREAFPDMFGGLYSQEEMPVNETDLPNTPIKDEEDKSRLISTEQIARIYSILQIKPGDTEERENKKLFVKKIIRKYGYESSKDIKKSDYSEICDEIETKINSGTYEQDIAEYMPKKAENEVNESRYVDGEQAKISVIDGDTERPIKVIDGVVKDENIKDIIRQQFDEPFREDDNIPSDDTNENDIEDYR